DGIPVIEGTVVAENPVGEDTVETVEFWRERAVQAEARVVELSEHVAVLSRILFGQSSEKTRPTPTPTPSPGASDPANNEPSPTPGPGGGTSEPSKRVRGQQRGSAGHGRRDYSYLSSREEIHDVPVAERVCSCCGRQFAALDSQTVERIDWTVQVTRVVHRRLRYRRQCGCAGSATVIAPPAPNP